MSSSVHDAAPARHTVYRFSLRTSAQQPSKVHRVNYRAVQPGVLSGVFTPVNARVALSGKQTCTVLKNGHGSLNELVDVYAVLTVSKEKERGRFGRQSPLNSLRSFARRLFNPREGRSYVCQRT